MFTYKIHATIKCLNQIALHTITVIIAVYIIYPNIAIGDITRCYLLNQLFTAKK